MGGVKGGRDMELGGRAFKRMGSGENMFGTRVI